MEPSWIDHIDLVQVLFGGAVTIIAFFIMRTLKQIDRNQQELFEKMNRLSQDFYVLQGEHRALKCNYPAPRE